MTFVSCNAAQAQSTQLQGWVYRMMQTKLFILAFVLQTPSNKEVTISSISSAYHFEVNPSDVGNNDYTVIRSLLKEIAETSQLDASKQRAFKGLSGLVTLGS